MLPCVTDKGACPRKVIPVSRASTSTNPHFEFLAYQLGFSSTWLMVGAKSQWTLADGLSPVPAHIRRWILQVTDSADELARLLSTGGRRTIRQRAEALRARAEEVWQVLCAAWNGPEHQHRIWVRNRSDEEH